MTYTAIAKKYVCLSALLILTACSEVKQSEPVQEARLLRTPYQSQLDNSARDYFVYLPKGYDDQAQQNWPVIFFLHGNGERGNGREDLNYVLSHGPLYEAWIQKKDLPFIIVSPQLHMFEMGKIDYIANRTPKQIPPRLEEGVPPRGAEFPTPEAMAAGLHIDDMSQVQPLLPDGWDKVERDLLAMLNEVIENYHADANRVYLTGLSYGGFGSWYMASKHPEKFAALAPVVGWGHPDLMAPIAQANLPVWAFAGGRDPVIKKQFFYPGINALESASGADIRLTVHEDMGHDAWRRVYASDDLYQWFLSFSLPRKSTRE